jgi:glycosyltransferase involved in cell wall biosynthesis
MYGDDEVGKVQSSRVSESRGQAVKMVVVSCVFPPEPVVSSRTSFDVARELAARGHEVTVLAPFPNRPAGKLYAGYRRTLVRREAMPEGIRLVRFATSFSPRSSMISRLAENVSFGVVSSLALLFRRKPAVVYVNTWPVFAAAAVAIAARLRRIPLVVSVQDIYPESLVSQQRIGMGAAGRLLMTIDGRVMRAAAAVVVISERFAEHYRRTRGVDPSRIHIVPNWLSSQGTEEVQGAAESSRDRNAIPREAFLLTYGGNVGVGAAVETVIEAFRHLNDEPDVHLLVAGDGASLDNCRRLAAEIAPRRIHFQNAWSGTMDVLHAADAVVLPTRGAQSTASVPSKLISYLLAGRPVLAMAMATSDTAAAIQASGAGVIVEPDDAGALAEAIRAIKRLPREERKRMERAGRAWAMVNVTTEVCLPRLIDIVESVAH